MNDIPKTAKRLKYANHLTESGRNIRVTSSDMDSYNSYTSNSHVSSSIEQKLCVGCVISIFEHTYLSSTRIFAYVSWFGEPFFDTQSNLHYVFCNKQTQSIVLFPSLSSPYATAHDDQEPEKLWILDK